MWSAWKCDGLHPPELGETASNRGWECQHPLIPHGIQGKVPPPCCTQHTGVMGHGLVEPPVMEMSKTQTDVVLGNLLQA